MNLVGLITSSVVAGRQGDPGSSDFIYLLKMI